MQDRKRAQQVAQEIAIVVRVVLPDDDAIDFDPLDEVQGLAETAGAVVLGGMIQRLSLIHI